MVVGVSPLPPCRREISIAKGLALQPCSSLTIPTSSEMHELRGDDPATNDAKILTKHTQITVTVVLNGNVFLLVFLLL